MFEYGDVGCEIPYFLIVRGELCDFGTGGGEGVVGVG